ncbi:MAG: 3-phosphoshikimate 1-carboxyvinyltransferase [Defluviicoccus sp.]|nr:3-phosphoshikimate 1-carboxyvinyltransferase [Defluviicoccus sp.]
MLDSGSAGRLSGTARVPGDKSISHRALIVSALAVGESRIDGLLEGEDVLATAAALGALGASVERIGPGRWAVRGAGVGGLAEPDTVLDLGNSGTSARLLLGVLGTHPLTAFLTGDASLRSRPMGRVAEPLRGMGATVAAREGDRLPLMVTGARDPVPIEYTLPVPSAQVKSAILLAALNTPGETTVIEPRPTRDHSELMLRHFGVDIAVAETGGRRAITLRGQPEIEGRAVSVPADISSAAFPGVAALLVPGSEVEIPDVGLNPTRTGLLECLHEMGAGVAIADAAPDRAEPVGGLGFRHPGPGGLRAIEVPAERAPRMIDEYPILAVAAAFAQGTTRMHGLGELRVKESDRLAAIAGGLQAAGVAPAARGAALIVEGAAGRPPGGVTIDAGHDHRIAMAFLVLGLACERPVRVTGSETIDTSFPGFVAAMNGLGAAIAAPDAADG